MKYRKFGKLNWNVSALGFGTMRLPCIGDDESNIDEKETIRMIRYAIDNGMNYVDTAYPYHGGNSELVTGKALEDGYRNKTRLATKLPVWLINSKKDMDEKLNEQLKKLKTDYIDFYLFHSMSRRTWDNLVKFEPTEWAEKKIKEGKINYIGFSFHDEFNVFKDIIDYYDGWDFCQIQYNYLDESFQAGTRGLKYAAEKGLAVVIMEPLRGGDLAKLPPKINSILKEANSGMSAVEWALQWVWSHPEVSVVLSGMSAFSQVRQNVEYASRSGINHLTEKELDAIRKAYRAYNKLMPIGCTSCYYCMPCPNGVYIPDNFSYYNEGYLFGNINRAKRKYSFSKGKADKCIECGTCEPKCPQKLPIIELLKKVHSELG
jgi:predicted aldo/keto reductase-like oxidoreductase